MCDVTFSTWLGFSAQVDYASGKWNLYWTADTDPAAQMTKANSTALNLATNLYSEATSLSIQSGDKATIDEVALAVAYESVDSQGSAAKIPSGTITIPAGVNVMVTSTASPSSRLSTVNGPSPVAVPVKVAPVPVN